MRHGRAVGLLFASLLLAGCQLLPPIPIADGVLVDGWVFPTPAPLPDGAVRLPLDVETPPQDVPDGIELGACPAALHPPVTLTVDRRADPPFLQFTDPDGKDVQLRWSYGISARQVNGVAEIVLPDGEVIVREGGLSTVDLGGGFTANDATFEVCITFPHRVEPSAT